VKVSAGSFAVGARTFSLPSPAELFADPPPPRKYEVYCVQASGHSCSSHHAFLPMTKSLTGELGELAIPEFASNHGRLRATLCFLKFSAFVPSGKMTSSACVQGPSSWVISEG
jgi:hypothetical protein